MDIGTLVIIIVLIIGGLFIAHQIAISNLKSKMESLLDEATDFTATRKFMGNDAMSGLAIDDERNKIALIKSDNPKPIQILRYSDVLASEILVDGETVTKTARGSQLGGALIGGLALGGVGAIIGGLSGSKRSSEVVKRVDLSITVNNASDPLHIINFMDIEQKKNSGIYKLAIKQAREWHGVIKVLIDLADKKDIEAVDEELVDPPNGQPLSVADEIQKLAKLRDEGVITHDEFEAHKIKILS